MHVNICVKLLQFYFAKDYLLQRPANKNL